MANLEYEPKPIREPGDTPLWLKRGVYALAIGMLAFAVFFAVAAWKALRF